MALSGLDGVAWRELWVGDDQDARLLPPLLEQIAAGASTARGALASVRVLVLADQPSEVAIHAPPFLVQALQQNGDAVLRRELVELLHDLALGGARRLFPQRGRLPIAAPSFEGGPSAYDRELWADQCHATVELLIPALLPFLEEVDDALVSSVIALLAAFSGAASVSSPALWKLAREEDDSALGGQALIALAQLGVSGVSDAARVMTDEHHGSALAFWSAAADVLASRRPSAVAIHHLVTLPADSSTLRCPFTGSAGKLQKRLLKNLPAGSFALALSAVSANPSLLEKDSGLRLLVRWTAGSTGEERRVGLGLLLRHARWDDTRFVRLLEEYELPATHSALSVALTS